VITVACLYLYPLEDKGEWAEEEIRIRKSAQLGRTEEEITKRREMIKKFLSLKESSPLQPLSNTTMLEVKKPSAWLVTQFDKELDFKAAELLLLLKGKPFIDPLKEIQLIQSASTISKNLFLRKERKKELDLLHYLLLCSGKDLLNSNLISSSLKQDLFANNSLRKDLQLGLLSSSLSPSFLIQKKEQQKEKEKELEILLQETPNFAQEFDTVLKQRVSQSNKKFSHFSI